MEKGLFDLIYMQMKYLKFFEELTPSIYRSAAKKRNDQLTELRKKNRGFDIDNVNIQKLKNHALQAEVKSGNFLKDKEAIEKWISDNCKLSGYYDPSVPDDEIYIEPSYTISEDGVVDVIGCVDISRRVGTNNKNKIDIIPIKFGKVSGDFDCSNNKLTSLSGCPDEVGKTFCARTNLLTSLKYIPEKIGTSYTDTSIPNGYTIDISHNKIISLEGFPEISGGIDCSNNIISSLIGCPSEVYDLNCSSNKLTDLVGSPKYINEDFNCARNTLTSTKGCPSYANSFNCAGNSNLYNIEKFPEGNINNFCDLCIYDCPISEVMEFINVRIKGRNYGFSHHIEVENKYKILGCLNDYGVIYKKSIIKSRLLDAMDELEATTESKDHSENGRHLGKYTAEEYLDTYKKLGKYTIINK